MALKLVASNALLSVQWHVEKNSGLTPNDLTLGSSKKVWWKCSNGHEWQAVIKTRANGYGCPFCSGRYASKGNSLGESYPEVASEWHPTKNNGLTPSDFTPVSGQRVWWKCNEGHEWQAQISNRTKQRAKCPYCAGKKATSKNCLAVLNPALAEQWHPSRNLHITPQEVTLYSHKKVWWLCDKGHEWQAYVSNRSLRGLGCPYCSNQAVNEANCLATLRPDISSEWHPTKNGSLTPHDVVPGSSRKNIWWQCKRRHEWRTSVNKRVVGTRCPICNPQSSRLEMRIYSELRAVLQGVSHREKINGHECDVYVESLKLAIEADGLRWHKDKYQKDKEKTLALADAGVQVIRLREKGLEKILPSDIHFKESDDDFEILKRLINSILHNVRLANELREILADYANAEEMVNEKEYVDLLALLPGPSLEKSLQELSPDLAGQWHPSRNGILSPVDVTPGSSLSIWWKCAKGHEWQAIVSDRTSGTGCPYCAGKKVNDENSLQALNPGLSEEWHPTKNGELTPSKVTIGSKKKVWWVCNKGHEWQSTICNRNGGRGCPYCAGKAVSHDNCLATLYPDLAKEWHPTKNSPLTPHDVTPGSDKRVWWKCSRGHEWATNVYNRKMGKGCAICYKNKRKTTAY